MRFHVAVIDVETGGLDPLEHALMEVALVNVIDGALVGEWRAAVLDPVGDVDPEALRVHGPIDRTGALPLHELVEAVGMVLEAWRPRGLAGHNLCFDASFVAAAAARVGEPNPLMRAGRVRLDTMVIASALRAAGRLEGGVSLRKLCEAFGVEHADRHTALGDARATAALLPRLLAELS